MGLTWVGWAGGTEMSRAGIRSCVAVGLGLLTTGCSLLDPSIYQGYGGTPPPRQPAGIAAARQQGPAAQRGGQLPFGATPRRDEGIWGVPKEGDVLGQSPDNVAIVVEKLDAKAASAMDVGGSFRARSGDAGISGGDSGAGRGGLNVRIVSGSFGGRIGGSVNRTRSSGREQVFIVVRSGTEGALAMGSDIWLTRLGYWTPRGYLLIAEREFVGRQLVVRPTILGGGQIAIELWPRFSTRRGGLVDVTQLATRVTVRDGQSLVIGGLNTADSELNLALFGVGGRESSGMTSIVLTAKIGGLDVDWPKVR